MPHSMAESKSRMLPASMIRWWPKCAAPAFQMVSKTFEIRTVMLLSSGESSHRLVGEVTWSWESAAAFEVAVYEARVRMGVNVLHYIVMIGGVSLNRGSERAVTTKLAGRILEGQ